MSPTPDVWNRRLFGCAMAAAAALGPKTLFTPQCVRADDSIRVIGDDGRPVAPPQPPSRALAAKPLTQAEVERRLGQIPVIVLVNEDDSPYFTSKDGGLQVRSCAPLVSVVPGRLTSGGTPQRPSLLMPLFPAAGGLLLPRPDRRPARAARAAHLPARRPSQARLPGRGLLPASAGRPEGTGGQPTAPAVAEANRQREPGTAGGRAPLAAGADAVPQPFCLYGPCARRLRLFPRRQTAENLCAACVQACPFLGLESRIGE